MEDAVLIRAIDTLATKVETFATKDRKRRGQLVVLTVSVVFDLMLSAGFFLALHGTNDAQQRTDRVVEQVARLNTTARSVCLAANDSAKKQHQLWEGLIAQTPPGEATSPERLAAFRQLIDSTFPERDCDPKETP